ncbi:MAG: hypothetical protein A2Z88_06700 [Omnitrophica WOR_2 bacterium GWA2_47_8]|nr:MAG: hypothetical protein A2Z88_06700 [Omnitrophica WOR_2 bacterium GWA2_47_8]
MSLKRAREVIDIEAQAIKQLKKHINFDFAKAVDLIAKSRGRIVITGMGKTGIIGRKIAATFSSTGTPSIWMHSAEGMHGDLGQVTPRDVVIVISHSGETEETKQIMPIFKKIGCKIITITGKPKSSLTQLSDIVLNVSVKKEGCPLGLAPMASTTATLVMGDALAACLIDRKGFKREDFALFHPGGALGKKLILKAEDIMRKGQGFPKVHENTKIKQVLFAITKARCGCACIVDGKGRLKGIFTDGDLRRHLRAGTDLLSKTVKEVMTKNPSVIFKERLAVEALEILQERKIDELPVIDRQKRVVGLLDIQDLLKAGLV